jgi:hypothetical protein
MLSFCVVTLCGLIGRYQRFAETCFLYLRGSIWSPSFKFSTRALHFYISHVCYMPHSSHLTWFNCSNNILRAVQYAVLHNAASVILLLSSLVQIFSWAPFSQISIFMFFLNVRGLLVTYTKTEQSLTSTQHSHSVLTTYTTKFTIGDIERECCYA